MKPLPSQHNSNSQRIKEPRQNARHVSLRRMKLQALSVSASHINHPNHEVVQEFGFFPKDIEGVIIHWPSL